MTHLDETYALLRDCWIAGGPGVQVAPDAWATLLTGDGDTDERRLLAIASQAFEVGLRPALGTHTVRPVLPQLANPVVPARLRPVVRRVLRSESSPARVLDLLARRGWTMHPLDWFPDPAADVPAVYAPWQDWAAQAAPRPQTVDPEQWRYLSPSGRRRGLRELRTTDPDAARALLAEHFGTEQAAVRLELLQVVGLVGLDAQDVPFLQSLATDRSGKVKTLACQLLARLGMTSAEPDDLAELRTFVTAKRKGLALVVRATETKTEAQARRRDQLFASVSLADLATALEITADDLISTWKPNHRDWRATEALVEMVCATGSDTQVELCATTLLALDGVTPPMVGRLRERLGPTALLATTRVVLGKTSDEVHAWCADAPVELDASVLASTAFAQLCRDEVSLPEAHTLALLCPPDVARQALVRLRDAGVGPHYLDMFTLSAELAHPTEGA